MLRRRSRCRAVLLPDAVLSLKMLMRDGDGSSSMRRGAERHLVTDVRYVHCDTRRLSCMSRGLGRSRLVQRHHLGRIRTFEGDFSRGRGGCVDERSS